MLGTERRAMSLPHGNDTLGELLAGLEGLDNEKKLLSAAGAIAVYKRAGTLPAHATGADIDPCEPDPTPTYGERAAHYPRTMLQGEYRELLGEWLRALAKMGKRLGEWELADALELGRTDSSYRELIEPVLGKRGLWLAAQRPDWRAIYLPSSAEDDDAAWETGDRNTRLGVLAKLRETRPEQARELIEATWAREPADTRAAFVGALGKNLSMDDEPFLESSLDDKSKQVREAAAGLLAKLPGSRLVARMLERVRPLVVFVEQRNLLRAKTSQISVTLPQQLDKSAVRDGVGSNTQAGRGQKAGWLADMLKCVPPSVWCDMWSKTPREIITAAHASEWKDALFGGWITATEVFKDEEWAEALLAHGPIGDKTFDGAPLLSVLPTKRREEWVLKLMQTEKNAMADKKLTWRMLWRLDTPWGAEVSRAVLRATQKYIVATAQKGDWELRGSIIYLARAMSPAVLDEAIAAMSSLHTSNFFYSEALDKFAAVAQFRSEMLRALWE
jgi:hypothetical protein